MHTRTHAHTFHVEGKQQQLEFLMKECVILIPNSKQLVANIDITLRKIQNLRKMYTNHKTKL